MYLDILHTNTFIYVG